MNSCLCEHQPLWARSWPATTLLLLSSGEEPAFLLILLQRKLPGNVVPVIIVSVFLGKCRRKYSTHSMCFAMTVSQQTRDENLHGHLRVTPKLRPNHQVSQASDAALRNCGDQDRSADSIRTVPGGVGLQNRGTHTEERGHSPAPASTCWHRRGTVCRPGKNCRQR